MRVWARLLAIAGVVVAADLWTKQWATLTLADRPSVEILGPLVRFTYTRNSGVAFGLGAGIPFPYYLFSIAAILVILTLFARRRIQETPRQVALALIMGGAFGNLVDRLSSGEVVDFIDIGVGRWHWPVFNVADSAVTIGVVLFALAWPRGSDRPDRAGGHESDGESGTETVGPDRGGAPGPLPGRGPDRSIA